MPHQTPEIYPNNLDDVVIGDNVVNFPRQEKQKTIEENFIELLIRQNQREIERAIQMRDVLNIYQNHITEKGDA